MSKLSDDEKRRKEIQKGIAKTKVLLNTLNTSVTNVPNVPSYLASVALLNYIENQALDGTSRKKRAADEENREAFTVFLLAESKNLNAHALEPITIERALGLTREETSKLYMMKTVFHNTQVFVDHHIFEKAVCEINDCPVDFRFHQELDPVQICWAIHCIRMVDDQTNFGPEVLGYIAVMLHEHGFLSVPSTISNEKTRENINCQFYLNKLNNHHETHDEEGEEHQKQMHRRIEYYIKTKQKKLEQELSKEYV